MDLNRSPTWHTDEYDYIIVGGGTAGLVVGCRLAEVSGYRVLVLEAGGNHIEDPRINIPAGWSAVLGSEVDWNFRTASQVIDAPFHVHPFHNVLTVPCAGKVEPSKSATSSGKGPGWI